MRSNSADFWINKKTLKTEEIEPEKNEEKEADKDSIETEVAAKQEQKIIYSSEVKHVDRISNDHLIREQVE